MQIATERELQVGWIGTVLTLLFVAMVLAGDVVLYFIYWNLPLLIVGVFVLVGGLLYLGWSLRGAVPTKTVDASERSGT